MARLIIKNIDKLEMDLGIHWCDQRVKLHANEKVDFSNNSYSKIDS